MSLFEPHMGQIVTKNRDTLPPRVPSTIGIALAIVFSQ